MGKGQQTQEEEPWGSGEWGIERAQAGGWEEGRRNSVPQSPQPEEKV